jgi:hypothetical protein
VAAARGMAVVMTAPTYFDHVARATTWDVVDMPPDIIVEERDLSDEEADALRRIIEAAYGREAA